MFENFKIAVRALIFNAKNELLLVSKTGEYWVTPGGFVDQNESFTEALSRELKEELNLEMLSSKAIYISELKEKEIRKLEIYFNVTISGEIKFNDPDRQVFHAKYFSKSDLDKIKYFPSFLSNIDFANNKKYEEIYLGLYSR